MARSLLPTSALTACLPVERTATSLTATLFLDARLWDTDGLVRRIGLNPELAGGQGLSGVQGIAGFPNGEITRVGEPPPTPYFARLFLRQTFGFGGEQEKVEDGPNQIAGSRDINRFTLSVGKFAATDFVDDNRYSQIRAPNSFPGRLCTRRLGLSGQRSWLHLWDRTGLQHQVLGVALRDRRGAALCQRRASGSQFLKANGQFLEWEQRYGLDDRPESFDSWPISIDPHGRLPGVVAANAVNPDVTQTAAYRTSTASV